MENLFWVSVLILVFVNFVWGLWYLGFSINSKNKNMFKPYEGSFKVKHLFLVFVLPSYLLHMILFCALYFVIKSFEVCSDPVTKAGKFLNKPLFSKEEK